MIGTLSGGGAERVISNLSLNWDKNMEKNIIMFGSNAKIDYPIDGNLINIDKNEIKNIKDKVFNLIYRVNEIKKIKKENPNSEIISFLEYPNLLNLLTRKYGKTIISVRNHMSSKHNKGIKSYFWNSTIKYLYGRADKIIVVSEEIKNDLVLNYKIKEDKIKVIYNSYPINEIRRLATEQIENQYNEIFNGNVIISAGRVKPQKAHWHLIRAFSKVKENVKDSKLVILGEGELKEELIELSRKLNIEKDVYFLGFKKNVFKYINASEVFVLSSLFEGFPNALVEAMSCGVPVISSDCLSGPREILSPQEFNVNNIQYGILENRYGILVPVCDGIRSYNRELTNEEIIMAESIISILTNTDLKDEFSKKSILRAKEFEINEIIKQWEELIVL
ncbi:glycosyltransferase [uncultured Clostridium sp.]|uniref:glycosyltransferase n=1 Tax=uncultured Clostridium sp. TaxID=59620 RepID=UPI00260D658A|nr:glycosyltransferase [uncultured Clostridium sp.]